MRTLKFLSFLLLIFSFAFYNCGGSDASSENDEPESASTSTSNDGENSNEIKSIDDAIKQGQEALNQLAGDNADVKPANFRKIKDNTPDKLAGLPRTKIKGSSGGFGNYVVSTVESEFRSDDGNQWIKVKTIDAGGIGKTAMGMGFASWAMIQVDEEGDDYWKRTSTMGDFKTFEECNSRNKRCELKLYSQEGIIAELAGYNVSMDDLKDAAKDLELEDIPGLRESD